jgi:hypothetical protein
MGFDSQGAPQFGLNDVKVAAYSATNDYGSAVDIPSVQMMGGILQVVSAQLEGDDEITDAHSQAIGGQVRIRFGSISIAALEVLLGISSVASEGVYDWLQIDGGDNMPYFGICGKIAATQGSGDTHIFLPKVKIMEDVTLSSAEYGQYVIPEVTAQAIPDATYAIYNIIEHDTATAVAIPPTNIEE